MEKQVRMPQNTEPVPVKVIFDPANPLHDTEKITETVRQKMVRALRLRDRDYKVTSFPVDTNRASFCLTRSVRRGVTLSRPKVHEGSKTLSKFRTPVAMASTLPCAGCGSEERNVAIVMSVKSTA